MPIEIKIIRVCNGNGGAEEVIEVSEILDKFEQLDKRKAELLKTYRKKYDWKVLNIDLTYRIL